MIYFFSRLAGISHVVDKPMKPDSRIALVHFLSRCHFDYELSFFFLLWRGDWENVEIGKWHARGSPSYRKKRAQMYFSILYDHNRNSLFSLRYSKQCMWLRVRVLDRLLNRNVVPIVPIVGLRLYFNMRRILSTIFSMSSDHQQRKL